MALDWLISGATSLIGGLFSSMGQKSRDKKNAEAVRKANEANERRVTEMNADVRRRAEKAAAVPIVTNQQGSVDVKAMMQGAYDAGFNPATWLRNGGMQAYAKSSTQVWNSQLMDAALSGSTIFQESMPPLSTATTTGEVIGNALTTGASAWIAEAQQERQNQFQMAMLNAQLEGANNANSTRGRSGYVPTAFLGGGYRDPKGSAVLASSSNPGGRADGPSAWKKVVGADGHEYFVPDQNVMPDAELYITPALMPWINPADSGHPSTAFKHAGDYIIRDWNEFWKDAPTSNPWMSPQSAPSAVHPPNPRVGTRSPPKRYDPSHSVFQ